MGSTPFGSVVIRAAQGFDDLNGFHDILAAGLFGYGEEHAHFWTAAQFFAKGPEFFFFLRNSRRGKEGFHRDAEDGSDCSQNFKGGFAATLFIHADGTDGAADSGSVFTQEPDTGRIAFHEGTPFEDIR